MGKGKEVFVTAFILFILILTLPGASAQVNTTGNATLIGGEISDWIAAGAMLLLFVTFASLMYIGYRVDKKLDKGEMRRAIAGTFVVGIHTLLILSLYSNIYTKEIILLYLELVGIVIGFYFGARTAEKKG